MVMDGTHTSFVQLTLKSKILNWIRPCYHINFTKKYWKLFEICSKNLKNWKFSFTPCWKEVMWQLTMAARAINFFQNLANRILVTRSKNHLHIECRFFSRKNLATGGWNHPQDAITLWICPITQSRFRLGGPLQGGGPQSHKASS